MRLSRMLLVGGLLSFAACSEVESEQDTDTGTQDSNVSLADPSDLATSLDNDQMWAHLEALQQIADANEGHRSLGSSGYDASVDYAVSQLESYGYAVVRDDFEVTDFIVNSEPVLANVSAGGASYDGDDLVVFTYSGAGDVTAEATFVDVLMPPPLQTNSSTSGCDSQDFRIFQLEILLLSNVGPVPFRIRSPTQLRQALPECSCLMKGSRGGPMSSRGPWIHKPRTIFQCWDKLRRC